MKLTLSWLKDYLNTDENLEYIIDKLTSIGLEVEKVYNVNIFNSYIIAKILKIIHHPKDYKLFILFVDIGQKEYLQIISKESNLKKDDIIVVATIGSFLYINNEYVVEKKFYNISSFGVICYEKDLLLNNNKKVFFLPKNTDIGINFENLYKINDSIIEINITPNRPDCANIYGIARDLSAAGIGYLKRIKNDKILHNKKNNYYIDINNIKEDSIYAENYSYKIIKNINNNKSPLYIIKRLISIGVSITNTLNDICNYLLLDMGYPFSIFDLDKINGKIVIRNAINNEKFYAINNKEYFLSKEDCIISDDIGPISIAGIIDSKRTICDKNTKNILLYTAFWDNKIISNTGRSLNILSDNRYRFERGVDINFMIPMINIVADKIIEIYGGNIVQEKNKIFYSKNEDLIHFNFSEINRLSGCSISKKNVQKILFNLGFKNKKNKKDIIIKVPSWRIDIKNSADIVEEIIRIYGIDNIRPKVLKQFTKKVNINLIEKYTSHARKVLSCRGMIEAITWSFISEKKSKLFGGGNINLKLENPISNEMSNMRPSLLPGLIEAANKNINKGFSDISLFEVSDIYKLGNKYKNQYRVASGIRIGRSQFVGNGRFWNNNSSFAGFFDAKADAISLLESYNLNYEKLKIKKNAPKWYLYEKSGIILYNNIIVCNFGELNSIITEYFNIKNIICGFEIFIDKILIAKNRDKNKKKYFIKSSFQKIIRDFSFVIDNNITSEELIKLIYQVDEKMIVKVNLFDIFEEKKIGNNKKSVAFEVHIQPYCKNLSDKDLEQLSDKIIDSIMKKYNGIIRKNYIIN